MITGSATPSLESWHRSTGGEVARFTLPDRPGAGELPPRILLFRRNLERFAAGEGDLREQIAITLYHELGHYLGMDEDDLERVDLAAVGRQCRVARILPVIADPHLCRPGGDGAARPGLLPALRG